MSSRNSTNNSFHVVCLTLASAVLRPQRFLSLVLFFLYVPLALANGPDVIKASRRDVSPPLSQMAIGGPLPADEGRNAYDWSGCRTVRPGVVFWRTRT